MSKDFEQNLATAVGNYDDQVGLTVALNGMEYRFADKEDKALLAADIRRAVELRRRYKELGVEQLLRVDYPTVQSVTELLSNMRIEEAICGLTETPRKSRRRLAIPPFDYWPHKDLILNLDKSLFLKGKKIYNPLIID